MLCSLPERHAREDAVTPLILCRDQGGSSLVAVDRYQTGFSGIFKFAFRHRASFFFFQEFFFVEPMIGFSGTFYQAFSERSSLFGGVQKKDLGVIWRKF